MSSSLIPYVIALYIRLSTEDSKVGSFSIENQKKALHQYVDAMEGVKNVEVLEFIDNGYSGTNFERPAVQELLDQIREGKINCIVVKDDCVILELNSESPENTGLCDVSSVF